MNAIHAAARRGPSARAAGVCLAAASVVLVPQFAFAADSGPTTIRAAIGQDGAVSSVQQLGTDGSTGDFTGDMPVTLAISHTASGSKQTYSYRVENTFSQTKVVKFDDTAGKPHHTSIQLQLPLVAQLGVDVPSSLTGVTAPGATITTTADGTRHVLWNMVLFTPLGSAAQDVSFTADGSGSPVAELRATAVDPTTTPGLSNASQSASAGYQQDDFWAGYASGANDGLKQIAGGLAQLLSGIQEGADGAQQLDAGTADAYSGSQDLTDGLGQINGGLDQLADNKAGLPAALSGVKQLKAGVDQVLAGIGDAETSDTLVNGADQLSAGLAQITAAFGDANDSANPGIAYGIKCAQDVVDLVVNGNPTATPDSCFDTLGGLRPPLPALSSVPGTGIYVTLLSGVLAQALVPINAAMDTQVVPGLTALADGAAQIRAGLSTGSTKNPGVKEGLDQVSAGLKDLKSGLAEAVDGIQQLDAGSADAFSGSQQLTDGLGQLSAGQHLSATGLPEAVDGVSQLLDGTRQARGQAIAPLTKQLRQASENGHKQLAVLTAAANLAASGPGGAGATYVLTQDTGNVALAADTSGSSHTGRNIGIGVGGFVLLLLGLGSGFLLGRQRRRQLVG